MGVQKGATQEDDLTARSKKCTDARQAGHQPRHPGRQDQVTADLVSGRTAAMAADSPVGLYAVKQTNGALAALGDPYDSAPYGYVLPKGETDFAQALVDSLKAADADGSYKAALSKWGIEKGAITDFAVNTRDRGPPRSPPRTAGRHRRPAVRHPWRWVAIAVIAVVVGMMLSSFLTNDRWDFPFALQVINYKPVIDGLWKGTILGTVGDGHRHRARRPDRRHGGCRQTRCCGASRSSSVVLPGHPALRLLVIIGSGLGYLYPQLTFGVPSPADRRLARPVAGHLHRRVGGDLLGDRSIWGGILGLGSPSPYMAEIARAGIQSVDRGPDRGGAGLA